MSSLFRLKKEGSECVPQQLPSLEVHFEDTQTWKVESINPDEVIKQYLGLEN